MTSNTAYKLVREIPIEDQFDIVVAGGGPAGAAAAICAGRLGARVLLAEGTGCLGGMGTSGLVSVWLALGDGDRPLIGGLMVELMRRMNTLGGFPEGVDFEQRMAELHGGIGYQPEVLKRLLDQMCLDSGVEIRFFTRVIDAECTAGVVDGVVINNVEGHRYIKAKCFIDATGDAVLSTLCGAESWAAGRDSEHIMPPNLCSAQAGIDWNRAGQIDQQTAVFKALEDGFFTQYDRHVPGLFRAGRTTGILNAGHLFGMDALNCRSLSDGMVQGRKFADEYVRFFRKYVPGCEGMEFVTSGSLMGVRESRRILGEYQLNYADYCARRSFPDQIAVTNASVDIHVYDTSDEQWERYRSEYLKVDRPVRGEHYGLPYGILVPKGFLNLWAAGRCISGDVKVGGAIRLQPECIMMGQAAGTAAVQRLRTGQPACDLDTATLVETLREHGAFLPQPHTAVQMSRS